MGHRVRMDVRRIAVAAALSMALSGPLSYAYATSVQDQPPVRSSPPNSDSTQPSQGESSSSRKANRKTAHRTTVAEEEAPPHELTRAEDLIQKKNYAEAEPLLHRVVEQDPTNYVAWFDLGFLGNARGKTDDSIAAYRKSVEAKPDVFESNLNLGLQLAKSGKPDAEKFLRAATQL